MTREYDIQSQQAQLKVVELDLKKFEIQNKAHEMRNSFIQHTNSRIDGLIRAVLLVAGGALSLSVGAFLRKEHPELSPILSDQLHWAWRLLALSMVGVLITLLMTLIFGNLHSERWGEWLKGDQREELKQPKYQSVIPWVIGLLAFGSLIGGMWLLIEVATQTL